MSNSPALLGPSYVEMVFQVVFFYTSNNVMKPCLVECPYGLDGPCDAIWSEWGFTQYIGAVLNSPCQYFPAIFDEGCHVKTIMSMNCVSK